MSARRVVLIILILAVACLCAFGQSGPPVITTQSVPDPYVGRPYEQTYSSPPLITATGGTPPYVWTFGGGNVPLPPSWLSISANGPNRAVLSGTPPTGSDMGPPVNFSVQVRDANNLTSSHTFGFIVRPDLVFTPTSIPNATLGTPFSVKFTGVGGVPADTSTGQPAYSWSMAPANGVDGLTLGGFTNGDATLSGTAQSSGQFSFVITVADGNVTTTHSYVLKASPALVITTTSLLAGSVGTPYSQSLAASGGLGSYTWSLAQGATLPAGLTLNPSGSISGTPTASANANFAVSVTDSIQNTTGRSFNLIISATGVPLSVTTTSLPAATVGTAYTTTLTAAGGTPLYTWSTTPVTGSVPAGLTINANGTITGTPAANAATSSFTVKVTDSTNASANSGSLSITVNPANNPPPTVTITPTGNQNPAQQPTVSVTLGTAATQPTTGTLTLTFASSVGGDDQMVNFTNGTRTASFTVAQGQTAGVFSPPVSVITGTVAGTITITAKLSQGGTDITPTPAPTTTIVIAKAVPVITKVTTNTNTSGGTFTISVTGYSTPRDMSTATFHFTAASGTTLAQPDVTVNVGSAFTTWYGSSASNAFGSQFTMTVQFSFSGPINLNTLGVQLTNSVGISANAGL